MLNIKLEDGEVDFPARILINNKKTDFTFNSKSELLEFGKVFSEIFTVYIKLPGEDEIKIERKISDFNYQEKNIFLDYNTVNVDDDDIDTTYSIYVCGSVMIIDRFAEWIPDSLEKIFFIICQETLRTNNTNFKIHFREYEDKDFVTFNKYE